MGYAALNDSGDVGFNAQSSGSTYGYYTTDLSDPSTVSKAFDWPLTTDRGQMVGGGRPSINDLGGVIFSSGDGLGNILGVFRYSSGILSTVVQRGDPSPVGGVFAYISGGVLNDNGSVVFGAQIQTSLDPFNSTILGHGMFEWNGGAFIPLAFDDSGWIYDVRAMNDAGQIAVVRNDGLYLFSGQSTTQIAALGAPTPVGGTWTLFGSVAINDTGGIAFEASAWFPGGSMVRGIFMAEDGAIEPLVLLGAPIEGGGSVSSLGDSVGLNDSGVVLFQAADSPVYPYGSGLYLSGSALSGVVSDGHGNPIRGAIIELRNWADVVVDSAASDAWGRYQFPVAEPGTYSVRAHLVDGQGAAPAFEVRHSSQPSEPTWIEEELVVGADSLLVTRNLSFGAPSNSDLPVSSWTELHDAANVYYQMQRYVEWVKQTFGPTSLPAVTVLTFADGQMPPGCGNACYYGGVIYISSQHSRYAARDRADSIGPENVEWHEFTHHFVRTRVVSMGCVGGNHGGYSNADTCDSFEEGLAEFLPTLASTVLDNGADSRYATFHPVLESNYWKAWTPGEEQAREDLAVAALLWDLTDGAAATEVQNAQVISSSGSHVAATYDDTVAVPVATLISVIGSISPETGFTNSVAKLHFMLFASQQVDEADKSVSIDLDGDGVFDVAPLDIPFLMHGFYPVEVAERTMPPYHYDVNIASKVDERPWGTGPNRAVGWTDHIPGSSSASLVPRQNTPYSPHANLLLHVQDTQGTPLAGAVVTVTAADADGVSILQDTLDAPGSNLFQLELLPHYQGLVSPGEPFPPCNPSTDYVISVLVIVSFGGSQSPSQLQFDNCQYTQAVEAATGEHAMEFTFTLPADADGDLVVNSAEIACGSDAAVSSKRPERTDGAFADVDDDGDTQIDEALPGGAAAFDCDGDGFKGSAESGTPLCGNGANDDGIVFGGPDDGVVDDGCPGGPAQAGAYSEAQFSIGLGDQDPCGLNGWPSDFVSGGIPESTNKVNILDLTSFLAPSRRLDTSPGHPNFDDRWDLVPGRGLFTTWIAVNDLTALLAGSSGFPPMLGGAKAFNHATGCPWPG